MNKDEIISAGTALLPSDKIKDSITAVRLSRDFYELYKNNYVPEDFEEKLNRLFVDWRDGKMDDNFGNLQIGKVCDWIRKNLGKK